MVNIRLQSPKKFDFTNPDDWPRWRRRSEQYRSASELSEESDVRQVRTLPYCLGDKADNILTSTNIGTEDSQVRPGVRQVQLQGWKERNI